MAGNFPSDAHPIPYEHHQAHESVTIATKGAKVRMPAMLLRPIRLGSGLGAAAIEAPVTPQEMHAEMPPQDVTQESGGQAA